MHGGPSRYAADRVLEALLRGGTQTSSRIDLGDAIYAIRMASNAQFNTFVARLHRELSEEQSRRQDLERLVMEIAGREQQGTTGFLWLKTMFSDTGSTDAKLRDASLFGLGSGLSRIDAQQMVDWDKAQSVTNATAFLSSALSSGSPNLMVGADLVASEILRRFEHEPCDIYAALEDAGLFKRFGAVDAGSAELNNSVLSLASQTSSAMRDGSSLLDPVVAGPDEFYGRNTSELRGGDTLWLPLTLSQPVNVRLEAPQNVAMSVMFAQGGQVLFRTDAGTPTTQYLSGGDYDIAIRACADIETGKNEAGSDATKSGFDIIVTTISGPPILPATPHDAPYELSGSGAIIYDGASGSGQFWLRTELEADETLVLQTSQHGSQGDVDTVVELVDIATGETLAANDDLASDNFYSYVEHHAASDTEVLAHIFNYNVLEFGTGETFRIDALILSPDAIIEPAITVEAAPDMGRASDAFLRIPNEEQRYFTATADRTAIYDLGGTNLNFDLYLAGTPVKPLRTDPDGGKLYLLDENTSYVIEVGQQLPDGRLADFRILPDDAMIDLGRETTPADGISIDNGATLLLPPYGGTLDIRASQSGEAEVLVTDGAGSRFAATVEIESDGAGADPRTVTLLPRSDGVLFGRFPVAAGVTYQAGFGFSDLSNVAGAWIGPPVLRSSRADPLEFSTVPPHFDFDGSYNDGGIWLRATVAAGDSLYVETGTLVRGEPGGRVDTVIFIYDVETGEIILSNDDDGDGLFSKIEWTAPDARDVLIEVVGYDGRRLGEGDVFGVEARLEPASAQ